MEKMNTPNSKEHGMAGQLNIHVLDKESEITGHGKHNRLIVSHCKLNRHLTVREDLTQGLAMSTAEDRKKVLNGFQRAHPLGTRPVSAGPSMPYQGVSWASVEHVYGY